MQKKIETKPFGLAMLTEIPAGELPKINGGHKHHRHFHTMFVSLPQKAFPTGDSG
jgi:hypothetical protein